MTDARAYLDWNASAPLRPEARAAMIEALDAVGNPSSVHAEGRAARAIVERAREQVAALVGCGTDEVIFTSGATEAAALCIPNGAEHCLPIEHDAVWERFGDGLNTTETDPSKRDPRKVERFKAEITQAGEITLVAALLCPSLDLIALQAANSETGVRQDVDAAARTVEAVGGGATYLCDAVQAIGRVPFRFAKLAGGDPAVLASAHKLGGPKGVGALVKRAPLPYSHVTWGLTGFGQESRRRPGTENVVGIAGFGAAAEAARRDLDAGVWDGVAALRDRIEAALKDCAPDLIVVGEGAPRLPNTSCLIVPGWKGETQVMQLDLAGFAVSAGSACSSGKVGPSRVLRAMGYDDVTASSAIRVSLGPTTTEGEVSRFIDAWTSLYRKRQPRAA